jgi:hypothetical protein
MSEGVSGANAEDAVWVWVLDTRVAAELEWMFLVVQKPGDCEFQVLKRVRFALHWYPYNDAGQSWREVAQRVRFNALISYNLIMSLTQIDILLSIIKQSEIAGVTSSFPNCGSYVPKSKSGECVTRSYCFQKVLDYFTHTESIKFQALNRYMYNVKIPRFIPEVINCRIEDCILVYTDYRDRRGAISVVVGKMTISNELPVCPNQMVEEFIDRHKMFNSHFKFDNRTWPCH